MKIMADPLYAETVPDGTFGRARLPKAERRRRASGPDPEGARRFAALAAEVSAIDAARRARRAAA